MRRGSIISIYQGSQEIQENLVKRVNELMNVKKGILLLDEHVLSYSFYLSMINRTNDWENRRLLRQFFTTAPLQEQFSGVLLSEEFMKQSDDEAIEFVDLLTAKGLLLGVRLDMGLSAMFGSEGEYIGTGLDTIGERFDYYKERGCVCTKWRSKYQIKDHSPSLCNTEKISYRLAKFASMSQASGLVPIISVEVVPNGSEDRFKARRVLEKLLITLMKALNDFDISIESTILEVTFVQNGRMNKAPIIPEDIAYETLEAFKRSLPISLGGILLHSSGLSEEKATQALNHIILKKEANLSMLPWRMLNCFGRAQKVIQIICLSGRCL
ncbi:fructose-bisphosphate aldolase [Halyomorpha halys]|uniref:fructose-bisphosphate aldolase n=1 Tax=Halyomorpha halys TaxID=286706 RepID=UPI0006D4CE50|nr:fructose-bisphosphate aldolase-like [Halyomorpha halys]